MIWLLLLAAIAALPFVIASVRPQIRAADRAQAGGGFAKLSQGVTHYQWLGPARGPVVVAVHGLSTPCEVWGPVAEGLGTLGYRVLVYDLYGRGLSDPATGRQDAAFFLRQLDDLIADQGLGSDLTLMGYSMGGAIATAFAATHPERMKRLILLAPAGIVVKDSGLSRFIRQVPMLGDWLHYAMSALSGGQRRGNAAAILSSLRHMLAQQLEAEHRKIGREDIPVVALWGDKDEVIPIRALGILAQWNRNARQETIAGADHALPLTHGAAVTEVLRDVLRE